MSLYVVATPIGNDFDLSTRACELLQIADVVVGEEHREVRRLLKTAKIEGVKDIRLLNEHSKDGDVDELAQVAKNKVLVLVSDCGTPGFCDPGADLVAACRNAGIAVHSVPGPSSLMAFLSVVGQRVDQFYFAGFLPANREDREQAWQSLKFRDEPIVLMDTPYRLEKVLGDLGRHFSNRLITLGQNLSTEAETITTGPARELFEQFKGQKSEFLILIESRNAKPERPSVSRKNQKPQNAGRPNPRRREGGFQRGKTFFFSRKKSKRK